MAKYSIAIVGAGPSGYFAAQALQNLETEDLKFSIDLIERLPTPWGLVRIGVAPDHPKIKSVSKVFEKVATAGNVSLFGNIEVGSDISLETLKAKYDAVILATGSTVGKKLGLPGEELTNSISAAEFVPWYNGHPDYADLNPDLKSYNWFLFLIASSLETLQGGTTCKRFMFINGIKPNFLHSPPSSTIGAASLPLALYGTKASLVFLFLTNSIAQKTPKPLTSPIDECFSFNSFNFGPIMFLPISKAFSTIFSSFMASKVATIEDIARG